jgi:hypothetical protein
MADVPSYETVLPTKASTFLVALSKPKQRRLIRLLFQLAENPNQIGDYSERDNTGRKIHFLLLQSLLIAFWSDHAVKEFRIVEIQEV